MDAVPEEASDRAKQIDSFLGQLDIKQVSIKQVLDSLQKIESNEIFECFEQRRKSSFIGSQSASSSSKAVPLLARRLALRGLHQFSDLATQQSGSNSVNINRQNSYIDNFSAAWDQEGSQNEFRRRELQFCNNKKKSNLQIVKAQSNC